MEKPTYEVYRHIASKLKNKLPVFLYFSLISCGYASFSVHKLGNVYRLKGPAQPQPQVSLSETPRQGGGCRGQHTFDLVLRFSGDPGEWVSADQQIPSEPCSVQARPGDDGSFEIRLSYPAPSGKKVRMEFLPFISTQKLVIDHWIAVPRPVSKKKKVKKKDDHEEVVIRNTESTAPSAKLDAAVLAEQFDSQSSWEKILGSAALALDFNSPELDRFRDQMTERNLGISQVPIELRPLKLPMMDLPPMESPLDFSEETRDYPPFRVSVKKDAHHRNKSAFKAVEDGMNLVRIFAEKEEWLKARESLSVLEKSAYADLIPEDDPEWIALRGYIYMRLGEKLSNKDMKLEALNIWRDGLRNSGGWGGESQTYLEYMALELVRNLFQENLPYAAASLLSWARRYSWSAGTEERFDYLRGEAFYRLGLYSTAKELFSEFVTSREDIPVNNFIDRRLVSAAAYRLGDLEFRNGHLREAVQAYTRAFEEGPKVRKFSFEGNWISEDARIFPYVLFNRAEANTRLGREDNALSDLRAFLFVAPSHSDSGLVYFRIGDLLNTLGAPQEKISGAWRECSFKVPKTLGGRLCLARKAAEEMETTPQSRWPRLVADIEDALQAEPGQDDEIFKNDLKMYLNMLLADAFLRVNKPYQALLRLDPLKEKKGSPYLKSWFREYLITAVVGYQNRLIREKKYTEVVKDYAVRRRDLFLHQTRPEALWNVARAYRGLGLYREALETIEASEKVRDRFARKQPRPYEPSREDWIALRVDVLSLLIASGDKTVEPGWIRMALERLDASSARTQRLWIQWAQAVHRSDVEAEWWAKLEGTEGLKWVEVLRYAEILTQLKRVDLRQDLVERRVGSWFGERQRVPSSDPPPVSLLHELFQTRAAAKNIEGAVAVADYLLGLPASQLGTSMTLPMIAYEKGQLLRRVGRLTEARQSFERAQQMAPDSLWGRLSSSAQKEMSAGTL